jgi:hypothetical protein
MWLARNQDDPEKHIGWVWRKHLVKLYDPPGSIVDAAAEYRRVVAQKALEDNGREEDHPKRNLTSSSVV